MPQIAENSFGLVRYDAMVAAIAAAHRFDEAKAIRDKAKAWQVYAAQATNYTVERKCAEIRIRAERRCGELLRQMKERGDRARQGGDRKSKLQHGILKLADLGVTPRQSAEFQQVAAIPQPIFDDWLKNSLEPRLITSRLLAYAASKEPRQPFKKMWRGMPEFSQDDLSPKQTLHVHFRNSNDVAAFADLVGQRVTPKTKYIWYPKMQTNDFSRIRYVDAKSPERGDEQELFT